MLDTFTRLTATAMRWARGEFAHRLNVTTAGLMPDAIADATRQVMRMLLPLDTTMPDMMPSQFTRFGLPSYAPDVLAYSQQLTRLQNALDTHSRAGSIGQMAAEVALFGLTSITFPTFSNGFRLHCVGITPLIVDGSWVVGDDICVDATVVSVPITRSLVQLFDYFAPDLFLGFEV